MTEKNEKIILIICISCLGDTLLTSALCRNLKLEYPDAKMVYLVNKPFYEAAKYMPGVDDVITFDRNKKGFFNLLKCALNCKYRNKIYAAFVIYGNTRGIILSYLLGAENRISSPTKLAKHLLTKVSPFVPNLLDVVTINNNFFTAFTGKKAQSFPVKYNVNPENNFTASKLKADYENLTGLCLVSEEPEKNMPLDTAAELIEKLNAGNKTPVFLGKGTEAREYADNLKKRGCTKFVDLVNITSVYDLANVLAVCEGVISIDTGAMHLAYAVNTPVVCVFYKDKIHLARWAPDPELYNNRIYIENKDFTSENLKNRLNELIKNSRSTKLYQ